MEVDRTLTTHAGAGCYEAITPTSNTFIQVHISILF